jgi:hypothetical protein
MGSSPDWIKPKTRKLVCGFSAKHAALKWKSKDWLARNQDNVSEWGVMSIRGMLFQWASTIKSNSVCWSRTKRSSSSSNWKLTCSRHNIAEKVLNWRYVTITRSLNESILDFLCGDLTLHGYHFVSNRTLSCLLRFVESLSCTRYGMVISRWRIVHCQKGRCEDFDYYRSL